MAIDRSKFKSTSVTTMQEKDKAVADSVSSGKQSRPGMLDINDGKNVYRIFPAHPVEGRDEQPPFSQPSIKVFLPAIVDEKDAQGNLTGQKKESQRPVFNARIHGGFEKDLVEEYVKLARAYAESKWGDDAKNKGVKAAYLDKVYGKYSKNAAERISGLRYQSTYVMYAKAINHTGQPFGRLEVKETIKKRMNEIAAEESADDPLGVDPYTDLVDGRCIVITYNADAKQASDFYRTAIDSAADKVTKQLILHPITDEDLEKFVTQPSLESIYLNVFSSNDLELQIQGLEMYDKKYNLGIVGTEDYEKVLSEISGYFSDEELPEEEEEIDEVEEEEVSNDKLHFMNRIELKEFIKKEKLGISIKTNMSDEDIRVAIRGAAAASVIPHEDLPNEDKFKETPKGSILDRVKGLGAKK